MYDILPDIHGQAGKLKAALTNLGYKDVDGVWTHCNPDRSCIFLGDFIDRGPDNTEVLTIVRRMIETKNAQAVIGNHELNAIYFHTKDPSTNTPLRNHSKTNLRNHQAFIAEFPIASEAAGEVVAWMQSLPLFLEFETFRIVHACWDQNAIDLVRTQTENAVLDEIQYVRSADPAHPLHSALKAITKGPELELPAGYEVSSDGHIRRHVRAKWWAHEPRYWSDVAVSVPDLEQLPKDKLAKEQHVETYPDDAKPVFFGHYGLTGRPALQSHNAVCLDYSAGQDGPLVSYTIENESGEIKLDVSNIAEHYAA